MRPSLPARHAAGEAAPLGAASAVRSQSRQAAFLLALFLAAVVPPSILAMIGRFDGLYGQDPYAYADYAALLRRGGLLRAMPLPPFYWPPGYPLVVALVSSLGLPVPLAGRVVSAIAGGLVPVFTYALAKEIEPPTVLPPPAAVGRPPEAARLAKEVGMPLVPAVAALVTAGQAQLWQSSAVVMADTLGLAAATASVWGLARYGHRRALRWLLLASAAMSLAILARWAYALAAIPCAAYAAVVAARLPGREAARDILVACAVGAAILAPMLVPALAGMVRDAGEASFAADLQVYTWTPLNALRRSFVTADGLLSYRLPNGLYYAAAPARPVYFTPLLAPLVFVGIWRVARRPTADRLFLIVGWAAVVYAFHAGAPWQNFRFTLAYLPPLAILLALGASALVGALPRWGNVALVVVLALALGWMVASGVLLLRGFIAQKDADLATVAWLDERGVPPTARILTFGITETLRHYSRRSVTDLAETGPADLAALVDGRDPVYVLLDVRNVEGQWQGRAPSANYHWLLDRRLLIHRGDHAPYALDEVCSPAAPCAEAARAPA